MNRPFLFENRLAFYGMISYVEFCANINKQIILFCSSEPKTEETTEAEKGNTDVVKTNIQNLISNIDQNLYILHQMKPGEKTISKLN